MAKTTKKNASAEKPAYVAPKHIEAIWRRSEMGKKLKLAEALIVFDWTYRTLTPKGRQKLYFDLMEAGYRAEVARRARQGKGVVHG